MWATFPRPLPDPIARREAQRGFTIVELLIVIVVIGILASITIVVYNGIQQRARDSSRQSGITTIRTALEIYKTDKGRYPQASSTQPVFGGWESSTDTVGSFMEYLLPYISHVPTDPTNTTNSTTDVHFAYWYYRYGAGSFGCDPAKGAFYVLRVRFENSAGAPASQIPSCTPNWVEDYVFIQFEQ